LLGEASTFNSFGDHEEQATVEVKLPFRRGFKRLMNWKGRSLPSSVIAQVEIGGIGERAVRPGAYEKQVETVPEWPYIAEIRRSVAVPSLLPGAA
jgi:hypothetical protein